MQTICLDTPPPLYVHRTDIVPPSLAREHLMCLQYIPMAAPTPPLSQRPAVLLNLPGLVRTRGPRGSCKPVPEQVWCLRVRVWCDIIKPVRDLCSTLLKSHMKIFQPSPPTVQLLTMPFKTHRTWIASMTMFQMPKLVTASAQIEMQILVTRIIYSIL